MKKIVLTVICFSILGSFVALNYLLWDREKKDKDITSYEASEKTNKEVVSAMTDKTDSLNKDIQILESHRDNLLEDVEDLTNEIVDLKKQHEGEIKVLNETIGKKDDSIAKKDTELLEKENIINSRESAVILLGKVIDCDKFLGILRKWGNSIIQQEYNIIYSMQRGINVYDFEKLTNVNEIEQMYKDKLDAIEITSIEPTLTNIEIFSNNEMEFIVEFNITLKESFIPIEGENPYPYSNGPNIKTVKFVYNEENNEWYINLIREPIKIGN